MKRILSAAAACAVALTGVAVAAPAAQAKTIKACVKKSDGSVKFINKKNKKCKKGWKLRTWNTQGPSGPGGPTGPAGPNWTVKDKNGVTLGTFAGYSNIGLLPTVFVTVDDGGLYSYDADGTLNNNNGGLLFTNNGCTDAVIRRDTNDQLKVYLGSAGGNGRTVFQVTGATTASAWKIAATTTTSVPTAANMLFKKDSDTGTCSAATHNAGFYVPLTSATPPIVAAPGPLQIVK
jgi:hypothetical protein